MEDVEEQFSGVKSAQFHSFAKRMPSYYASVGMMMAAIAFVFHSIAPFWLSCVVPFVTILLAVARGRWW